MMDYSELTTSILEKIDGHFDQRDITLDNILEIVAIAMNIAETWQNGSMNGAEKRNAVLNCIKKIVSDYAHEDKRQDILDYVDTFGGMGVELIIWLSKNPAIMKNINSFNCLKNMFCFR